MGATPHGPLFSWPTAAMCPPAAASEGGEGREGMFVKCAAARGLQDAEEKDQCVGRSD